MKARGVIGGLCVVGVAVAAISGVVLYSGRPGVPTGPVVQAAEPPAEGGKGGVFSYQYESTKPRTVVDKLTAKYAGPVTNYQQADGEYELRSYASRTRTGGRDSYRVGVGRQFVKVDGATGKPDAEYYEFTVGEAAAAILFIDRMKGAKKAGGGTVDYAVTRLDITIYAWDGSGGFPMSLSAKYDGKVTFTFLTDWMQSDADRFAKVLTEGLKDVETLKKAEWSPTP